MLHNKLTAQAEELAAMSKPKVLIVDDEHAIRRFLRTSLGAHGYDVHEAATGEDAILQAVNVQPDLIILDLGLPDISGIEVTRRIREWAKAPIVILSVKDQDTDKIEALDAGADDYLTKPFSVGELMARLRVAMRHAYHPHSSPIFETNGLRVDLATRRVTRDGETIQLTRTEYDLLRVLVQYAGRVMTHQQLLREVRGVGYQAETHLLRVHMSNLRRKLEKDPTNPQFIATEPGVGYRLTEDS
jgi:two-component system, OmpR family, KDP operon response regulator KdpE